MTRKNYWLAAIVLFLMEATIAIYFKDRFVRPYVGDYLVVIFLYCVVQGIRKMNTNKVAIGVLLFSYLVEFSQWIDILSLLQINKNGFTDLTLGNTFEWGDMLAYTLGIATVILFEKRKRNQ